MRKLFYAVLCATTILSSTTMLLASTESAIVTQESYTIEDYQQIIDKVNAELGSSICFDSNNLDATYDKICHMSLNEFETYLKDSYLEVQNSPSEFSCTLQPLKTRSISDTIEQRIYGDYATFFIKAKIFSGTGASGSYVYREILNLGTYKPSSGSIYFVPSNSDYSLNSNNTVCYARYIGTVYNNSGIILTTTKTYKMNFYAN